LVAGMGNSRLLCADPETGEIKRFMTGPNGCEITGMTFSPDNKHLFVGIQHPRIGKVSHFPDREKSKPRSSVVVVTRQDGGIIGD